MRPWNQRHRTTITVTRHPYQPDAPDRRGHNEPAWGPPQDLPGCLLAPGTSSEPAEAGRDKVLTQATIYAPPGTTVTALDRITTPDGTTWQVTGTPASWPPSPVIGAPDGGGVVVTLTRTTG